ncbi:MAG: hypothetical protein JHC95_23200 [Solirubrobacteraceae bacterium]|nr:hypothetical protein [Solirubrobacteraceae bacterium]
MTFEYGSLKKLGKTGAKMTVRGELHVPPPAIAPPAAASAPPPAVSTSAGGVPVTTPGSNPFAPPAPFTGQPFFVPGVQAGASRRDAVVSYVLRAPIARAELEIGTDAATVEQVVRGYAKGGLRVLLLAGFHGRIPSVAEAQSLKEWARVAGPAAPLWKEIGRPDLAATQIEFGNETSFAYQGTQKRGGEYAQRVRDAANAIRSVDPGVGLLVQADDANQSDNWNDQMFAAVPELANYSAGWTVHPYGPQDRWQSRIDDTITELSSYPGADPIPIMITEYGIATDDGNCLSDNYGWPLCLTYAQAAADLRSTVLAMKSRYGNGRIGMLLLYNDIDLRAHGETGDREHYFGARQVDGQRKGDYTAAVEELMAAEAG